MVDHPTDERSALRPARSAGGVSAVTQPRVVVFARRRWIFRSTVTLAMAAVALCFFVAWRRDQAVIHDRIALLSNTVKELQAQVDVLKRLPAERPESTPLAFPYYLSDTGRYYASQATDPVIIAATDPVRMLFKSDGLAVIVYDKGKVSTKWMLRSDYDDARSEQDERIAAFEKSQKDRPIVLP